MDEKIQIGIIGGSGLYNMEGLSRVTTVSFDTPFGHPSDDYVIGTLKGVRVAFLPRHGQGHRLTPSEINYRANIYGFKQLGASHIISVTAVGSLKEDIQPLDIVIPDQFYDRTRDRKSTFFGDGLVAHIAFAQPICPELAYCYTRQPLKQVPKRTKTERSYALRDRPFLPGRSRICIVSGEWTSSV